jgi:hypothetical protein
MHMNKLLLFILTIFSQCAFSHEIDVKKYSGGAYASNSFDYPASLSNEQVKIIVDEVKKLSRDGIFYVTENEDGFYNVVTCSEGERYWGKCKSGEIYLFGNGRTVFSNFSITSSSIGFLPQPEHEGEPIKYKEYFLGKYSNLIFNYPSSLSEDQIEEIVEKISTVTKHGILSIGQAIDSYSRYPIRTCTEGARIVNYCIAGEYFEYEIKSKSITNSSLWQW